MKVIKKEHSCSYFNDVKLYANINNWVGGYKEDSSDDDKDTEREEQKERGERMWSFDIHLLSVSFSICCFLPSSATPPQVAVYVILSKWGRALVAS